MDQVLRDAVGAAGIAVVLVTVANVVAVLLVPRGRISWLFRSQDSLVGAVFGLLTRRTRQYQRRDAVLAVQAPVLLIVQLLTWLAILGVGFTLALVPCSPTLAHAGREALSSMLTLGFTSTFGVWATVVDAAAAVCGLVVIALQIAYLPTLYGAYNRRETEVTLLQVRAGEPPWGPELLARTHYGILGVDLTTFYTGWERWAADLAESHVSYPVLLRFRSPRPLTSWVVAMLAVLDAAAMQSAVAPRATPVAARLFLRMGFVCLRRLASTVGIPVDEDPHPDGPLDLTFDDFREGYQRLVDVGYPVERPVEEAWPQFRGWRVNYEAAAYALARELDAVPARWAGTRRSGDAPIDPIRPPNRRPEAPDDPDGPRLTDRRSEIA
jgi:hypothetical protein